MEDHGQQGACHSGAALGPATPGLARGALALPPGQAGPQALARDPDVSGATAAAAAPHHGRQPRRTWPGASSSLPRVLVSRPPCPHGGVSRRTAVPRPASAPSARTAPPAHRRMRFPLLCAARGRAAYRGPQERCHLSHPGLSASRLSPGKAKGSRSVSRRGVGAARGPGLVRERNGEHSRRGRGRHFGEVSTPHRPTECRPETTPHHQRHWHHIGTVKFEDTRRGAPRSRV